ncbi:MarR family winged helix-turn-helix transcriptional regulator [Paraburkholderia sacchari]|uniref:Winged helix-turn-helix transcriptional regulator n=1 Tax=Paraburkholderia sacchari TaxID=159450 RepID=A0A8T6ZB22_9BURK|nr:MarR family winged helix-turn-helix transcriptional regulator [Paraburkholderia sacchari]NLP61908.1 winged helix-turn-helix transcriptional regulator [Paraburkholderia sacchari]
MNTESTPKRTLKRASAPTTKPTTSAAAAPMRFLDTYLAALLARASSLISDEFHATLARKKIPVLQWRVLACLSDGSLPMGDLGRVILAKQPTVSKLIDRMEAAGLVVRQEDPASRRRTLVALTPHGSTLAAELVVLALEHEASVLLPFEPETAKIFVDVLRKLIEQHAK